MATRKTPTPKGKALVPEEATEAQLQGVFGESERRDAEAIVQAMTGQDFGKTLGIIPYKSDLPYAKKDYGKNYHAVCAYCRKGDAKHVHAPYIGVGVINEVARHFKGIHRKVISRRRSKVGGQDACESTAGALDIFSGNYSEATVAHVPKRGERPEFTPRIADTMAKRNAMKEILPQFFMERLKGMALDGTQELTRADAAALINSFGEDRAKATAKYSMFDMAQVKTALMERGDDKPALPAGDMPSGGHRGPISTPATPPANDPPPAEEPPDVAPGPAAAQSEPQAAIPGKPGDIDDAKLQTEVLAKKAGLDVNDVAAELFAKLFDELNIGEMRSLYAHIAERME